jgi:DNA-binding transcriptional MerR regulator
MKIGDLAQHCGVSVHTLRYYEQIGLFPTIPRDRSGHRVYGPDMVAWVSFLGRLKSTGMPLQQMVRYAQWREQGPTSAPQRQALLEQHREQVRAQISHLQDCLDVLDRKIAGYAGTDKRTDPNATLLTSAASRRKQPS